MEEGEGGGWRVMMHTTGGDSPWGGLFTMSTTVETVFVGQLIWREGGREEALSHYTIVGVFVPF